MSEQQTIYVAMGCFWGIEKKFQALADVFGTQVGYMGGTVPNPTYELVCTGTTGHAEAVRVDFEDNPTALTRVLHQFWEGHNPTQGDRQGNDIGTQYRSVIFYTTEEQRELAELTMSVYQQTLTAAGVGQITTEILPADENPFYPAEDYHQAYLVKNPNGYDCHSSAGVKFPEPLPAQ